MGMGGQCYAPAALPPGKTCYPLYRRLGGSQGRSGQVRKISSPPGFDPRTVQVLFLKFRNKASRVALPHVQKLPKRACSCDAGKKFNLVITYLLTYLLTPSWEANWFAASQEIPRISRNPNVHYRTHKRPPSVSILGQPNPVHIPTSHLLEIHSNITHPSTPRPPQWSLSLRFPHQDRIHPFLLTHTRHMPSSSHSSRFYHPHNIGWGVQII